MNHMFPLGDILLYALRNLSRKNVGLLGSSVGKIYKEMENLEMKEAGCQFCEFFKLGIFKNWAFHIENQNKLLHFPEIGLQLHFILSKIVLDFMMNRSWVLNFTFWMRLKANWMLGRSDLWNLLLVVWVAVRENWKYCVPAPYQLFSLFLCPPIPVNKLESNKKKLGQS